MSIWYLYIFEFSSQDRKELLNLGVPSERELSRKPSLSSVFPDHDSRKRRIQQWSQYFSPAEDVKSPLS
jgi:hypothetical protein